MKHTLPISSVMTTKIAALNPSNSVEQVRRLFEQHGFHHAPVVEGRKLVGIVSYTDYLRVVEAAFQHLEGAPEQRARLRQLQVSDMMTPNPVHLGPDDTIGAALAVFKNNPFHALPIVNPSGELLGILTTYDVMKVFEDVIAPEHSFTEQNSSL